MTVHSERLLARLGERGAVLAADPHFAPLLEGLFDRAEGRLPHRPIRRDAVADRVAEVLMASDGTPDCEMLSRLNASDLYLVLALVGKDIRALEIAESELMPVVRQAIGRIDSSRAFIDEVSQRVRERLFLGDDATPPTIMKYRGIGPLGRWVRVVASRMALELVACRGEGEEVVAPVLTADDPALEPTWRACADEYKAVLAEAFASLSRRERTLLRQHYHDGLNIDTLGRIYRVNPSTTARWLKQVEDRLAAATRAALITKLAIRASHVPTLERLVANQLQLTLPRMLRGDSGNDDDSKKEP
jgi:RNA polymerase sigma-70 factor (ECF subfamily)